MVVIPDESGVELDGEPWGRPSYDSELALVDMVPAEIVSLDDLANY